MASDTIPVTGVDDLDKHLDKLISDPSVSLEGKLFDDVELQLTDANIPPLIPRLLPKITEILAKHQQDPAFLCSLAIKLLGPLSFTQIMSLTSEDAIIQAVRSPAPSANLLALTVLEKASKTPSEAAILAVMKDVMTNFLTQWLSSPEVKVGEKGSMVLGELLDIDCDTRAQEGLSLSRMEIVTRKPPGQGLMWRRIFQDRDIYSLLLSLCSAGPHQNSEEGLSEQQLSLAQGRLLRIMPRLAALNLAAVSRTDFSDLNQRYLGVDSNIGLLHFVTLHMINKEDMLMHLSLIDFFETFLSIQCITPFSRYKMDTLKMLVSNATTGDPKLKAALFSLPDRTVAEEATELRSFLRDVL